MTLHTSPHPLRLLQTAQHWPLLLLLMLQLLLQLLLMLQLLLLHLLQLRHGRHVDVGPSLTPHMHPWLAARSVHVHLWVDSRHGVSNRPPGGARTPSWNAVRSTGSALVF